jgi:peptidoglycan hydrolase-like protein with peptidoglycan-binding domain
MMTPGLRLSTALVLSLGLSGAALAQTPATPDTNAGAPQGQMQQGAGTPTPTPTNPNMNTNAGMPNTNAGMPNTTGQYGQEANPSPEMVKQAQQQLKSEGFYKGAIDGRIGPATRNALRQFQQQHGLAANSMLDQETMQRLMKDHHG